MLQKILLNQLRIHTVKLFFSSKKLLTFTNSTRNWYLFFTCILPVLVLTFFIGLRLNIVDWQSGELHDYLYVFLSGPVLVYFTPFFTFSVVSLLALYWNYQKFATKLWVKVGILSGFFLALKYTVLGYAAMVLSGGLLIPIMMLVAALAGPPLLFTCFQLYTQIPQRYRKKVRVLLGVGILFAIVSVLLKLTIGLLFSSFIAFGLFASILGGPVWATMFAAALSWQLWQPQSSSERRNLLLGFGAYSVLYDTALYLGIRKSLEVYSQLPTQPPSCFVATAAANGHPGLVGSWQVQNYRVTQQLQYVKFFEIVLQHLAPHFHRWARRWYNQVGPQLAARITHPLLADLAFVVFMPIAWLGRVAVILWPDLKSTVEQLYTE